MPNYSQAQSALPLPSAALGNATSETQFTTTAVSGGLAAASVLMCRIPASNVLKGRPFVLNVAGRVTTGTTSNYTAKVYFGGNTTPSNNTQIATTGAVSVASAKSNWGLNIEMFWDSTSQVLNGVFYGWNHTSSVAQATLSAQPTSVDLSATEVTLNSGIGATSLVFTVTGLFGSSNASNTAFVDVFEVSAY